MTIEELKVQAKKNKQEGNIETALDLYSQLWEKEKNEWNGYFLAQCLRKAENFEEARKLHTELEKIYPTFKPLQNDKLWLDYSEKIKDWNNQNLVSDAEDILKRADKYDKYTSSVFTKTVLNVIKHLCHESNYSFAFDWLLKLDQSVISNSVFNFHGQTYPADRKVFFIRYADILIHLDKHIDYIEMCLKNLKMKQKKQVEFKKFIIEDITFEDYISRVKLAKHIKNFQEEYQLRLKTNPKQNYNEKKITLISDLSHYLFCPISFAINETYSVEANTSWEKDEWLGEKKLFIDRHKIFSKSKSYEDTFKDCEIEINQQLKDDFYYLFNSVLRVNNATNPKPTIYSNETGDLKGAPDYVMQDTAKTKFAITEKFSSIYSADSKSPFESDLVKHYAFIDELDKANLDFGYLITWYWQLTDVETNSENTKKKIVVTSYRLTKIEKSQINSDKLSMTLNQVNSFKKNKAMDIDGERISFPNKCLNCSVVAYCNHKTGNFNRIKLPYNLSLNKIEKEPKIELHTRENIDEDTDGLPF
ncbi:MAG: tetratricopeptide repeat protein [Flavobacteriales bacterium]|jgi:tetratricopeptide (TPR) repeat protein|nr:tetratricopeptide repeat protein [Flavobacteriales bacterium]